MAALAEVLRVTSTAPSDEDLVLRSRRGDKAAFESLVRRHAARVHGFCERLVGPSDAEDRVQEAFLRVFLALGRFDPQRGRFASWVTRIAHNACLDHLRARRALAPLDEEPAAPATAMGAPLGPGQADGLEAAVAALPERHRAVLHLKFTLGLDATEVASALGTTPGNARVLLHRAVAALRARFQP